VLHALQTENRRKQIYYLANGNLEPTMFVCADDDENNNFDVATPSENSSTQKVMM